MIHTLIGKMHFEEYGRPKMRALLRPKADNILLDLGWAMTDGIKAGLHVFLNNGGANFSEDAKSLKWGVFNALGKSHIDKV